MQRPADGVHRAVERHHVENPGRCWRGPATPQQLQRRHWPLLGHLHGGCAAGWQTPQARLAALHASCAGAPVPALSGQPPHSGALRLHPPTTACVPCVPLHPNSLQVVGCLTILNLIVGVSINKVRGGWLVAQDPARPRWSC